jgi:electron transport complex protein RnfD
MLLPAGVPWWAVITGTFFVVVIGKQIWGGIGANPFNPVLIGLSVLLVSWPQIIDFDQVLANFDTGFNMAYPLYALKHMGPTAADAYSIGDLMAGRQSGGIGAVCGYGLILGGIYLMARGFIRWEIAVSFLLGVFITALSFWMIDSAKYASPFFHLFTGYTLIGAFFLVTEDSSSPVNFIPMLIYGAAAGIMTILIRNIGAFDDGVVQAVLLLNVAQPLIDKIRPKAIGKGV